VNKYYLIGIPNSGKSTLGRLAANKLHLPFYDTDTILSNRIDNPLDMFKMALNGQFLKEQLKIISKLGKLADAAIISTGAEAALAPECAAIMKNTGTIIHVQRKPEILLAEHKKNGKQGVVMKKKGGKKINMEEQAIKLYAQEYSQYEELADLSFENNGTEAEGLEKLLDLLKNIST